MASRLLAVGTRDRVECTIFASSTSCREQRDFRSPITASEESSKRARKRGCGAEQTVVRRPIESHEISQWVRYRRGGCNRNESIVAIGGWIEESRMKLKLSFTLSCSQNELPAVAPSEGRKLVSKSYSKLNPVEKSNPKSVWG